MPPVSSPSPANESEVKEEEIPVTSPSSLLQQPAVDSGRRPSGFNGVRGSSYNRLSHRHNQTFCQVECCGRDLVDEKDYYRRYKVCHTHATQPAVMVRGVQQRFCQQCGTFHTIGDFDQDKRSCRHALALHNIKRRKRNPDGSAKPSDPSSVDAAHMKYRTSHSTSAAPGRSNDAVTMASLLRTPQNARGSQIIMTGDPLSAASNAARFGLQGRGSPSGTALLNGEQDVAEIPGNETISAAARSSYQAMLLAASQGSTTASQQVELLRQLHGGLSGTGSLLAAMRQQQPDGGISSIRTSPPAIHTSVASPHHQQQEHDLQGPSSRGQSTPRFSEVPMAQSSRAFIGPYTTGGSRPDQMMPAYGGAPSNTLADRPMDTSTDTEINMQHLTSQFGKPSGQSSFPQTPNSHPPHFQQSDAAPSVAGISGHAATTPALPVGLSVEDCLAIAQAFTEASATDGNNRQPAGHHDTVAAAKAAAVKAALIQRHQHQLAMGGVETMGGQQASQHIASPPRCQAAEGTQQHPLFQLEQLLLKQQQSHQQQLQQQAAGPGPIPLAHAATPPQQEGMLSGLTAEETELILNHRAKSGSVVTNSNGNSASQHNSDPSHKARVSSAFQPYGSGSDSAAPPASSPSNADTGTSMTSAFAAMAAQLNGGSSTGWPSGGSPHQLPAARGSGGMAIPASLPAANFLAQWPSGLTPNALAAAAAAAPSSLNSVAGGAEAVAAAAAALNSSNGAAGGGGNAPNLLSWFRGLPLSEPTGSTPHPAVHSPFSNISVPLQSAGRAGGPGYSPGTPPTSAELWAALQVLKSSQSGALAQLSDPPP